MQNMNSILKNDPGWEETKIERSTLAWGGGLDETGLHKKSYSEMKQCITKKVHIVYDRGYILSLVRQYLFKPPEMLSPVYQCLWKPLT